MTVQAPTPPKTPRRWMWTGEDLLRLGELGLLPPEGRFELMDGEILESMPTSPLHDFLVTLIAGLLSDFAGAAGFHVRQEKALRLSDYHSPRPDVVLVRGPLHAYTHRFPGPEDAALVIEIADTSLQYDRTEKLAAYAAARVVEYWIVNLPDWQVEVYRDPREEEYRSHQVFRPGDSLTLLALPAASLAVDALLAAERKDSA